MDRQISSQLQSNSNQSKSLSQSLTDPSVSGRQQNRFNSSRRKNESNNRNVNKCQSNSSQINRQSAHGRGGRTRGSGGSGPTDVWSDHLRDESSEQLNEKLDNKKIFGSKKHNLNHLLNFTFDSRDQTFNDKRVERRGQQRGQRYAVRYNKEHFLQANCQFIVNDMNDYSIHSSDPDISVDWNAVEEIRFNSLTAETYCPICLDSPVAPKMTRCGHIFCWSCVLHYLALSDHRCRKCPICFDSIQSDDLRTVSSISKVDHKIGDFITLCLMKRKKGSTITSPVLLYNNSQNCLQQKFEPLNGNPVISSYQKILIASPNQVLDDIIERERNQLMHQLVEDKETPEVCFIESALGKLKQREELLWKRCQQRMDLNANMGSEKDNSENRSDEEFYYFYQSEDGQQIYLNSLNVRMLKHQFGGLDNCPHTISAKIIETEWESMSEDLRKRHRYLQHLPLTCEFRIVELEFDSELISNTTLEVFRNEVIRRQKIRSKREREERRRERHIQNEQNKRIHGIYPRPKYLLDNLQQFPTCANLDSNDVLHSISHNSSESSIADELPLNEIKDNLSVSYGISPPTEPEFPSFAAMLREGKATKPVAALGSRKTNPINDISNNESDEEYHRPLHNYSLCDAFEAALELKSCGKEEELTQNKKSGSSKKKKNKPKLLMSTGMKRLY